MPRHERMFRHEHASKLDDPDRQRWLPADIVIPRLALEAGMCVADIGAGTGYFAIPIARAVSPGGRVFAVDLQHAMLEDLRARLEPGLPVVTIEGDAVATTLADASVDRVLLANVWHELDDEAGALAEAARILRPEGRIAILDWRTDVEEPPGPPLEHRVAASEVRAALRARGWKVESPEPIGHFSYIVVASRP
jgi:ubiquinone/menaquinone biosynthesis C-methylase UbiE